jgi:glycerate kinase
MVEGLLQHGFTARSVVVDDALGRPIEAAYARAGTLAVIELAAASGLQQIAVDDRDPLQASTFGTGQLIRHAIDAGASSIVVGTGGSATTDGGAGMLAALGARMLDADGREITRVPRDLDRVHRVDLTGLVTGPADLVVTVAADVENPLLGLEGAVQVFGLQKGVSPDLAPFLEESLTRWADAVEGAVGGRIRDVPGAGAAGGTAFALAAAYGASIRSGIEIFLNISKFADVLRGASLVVTGEGTLDDQTLSGKAPLGVSKAAGAASIPTIAIAGMNLLSPAKARKAGLAAVYSLSDIEPDPERSMRHASRLLAAVAEQVGRDIADTLTTLAHDGDAAVAN